MSDRPGTENIPLVFRSEVNGMKKRAFKKHEVTFMPDTVLLNEFETLFRYREVNEMNGNIALLRKEILRRMRE